MRGLEAFSMTVSCGTEGGNPDCAWCGGECFETYQNRQGEVFCSPGHRSSSNRALRRAFPDADTPKKRNDGIQ